jgi:transcriptional regulator with XRE-family HTH domain
MTSDAEDRRYLAALVSLRKSKAITQEKLAELTGWSMAQVEAFEAPGADPYMRDIRLYALAIGARIDHKIAPVSPKNLLLETEEFHIYTFGSRVPEVMKVQTFIPMSHEHEAEDI